MNENLLHKKVQEYLKANEQTAVSSFALKASPFSGITSKELAQQLAGRQKAKHKLPSWFANSLVLYPPVLNLEQTSSEKTANYKSELVSGNSLVDVTGGFGIDSYYFSKKITSVIHCELNESLQQLAAHNFKQFGINNVQSMHADGIQTVLAQSDLDWVYIDPSRRNDVKGKVFFLEDCLPNVPEIQEAIFKKTSHILVKTAPILDIAVGMKSLKFVKEIHVVAVKNEVKELLWLMENGFCGMPKIIATNILKSNKKVTVNLTLNAEKKSQVIYGETASFLYEPYASLMKTGAFNWISEHYQLSKLATNSHLYTSNKKIEFAGRVFKVNNVNHYNKKTMKTLIGENVNVVTRNFKETVAQLRKKYKLKEGAERYLFFTTDMHNKQIVIDCIKLVHHE
ncbi:THUMP-like domain-containing protein [Aquimarina agarivorans]|uniref:THUMP-like domain-containing protein n=1 Tax=Aquimarina agarivorans TaxID=980584 RepID=UPI000248E79C|nr:hypothetical protein [Aquimarina agarivorans]